MTDAPIQFIDLAAQRRCLGTALDDAILAVVNHGGYIMGPEIAALEKELASFTGAKHALTCSNGTDAITLVLRARGVGPGDAVICPSFTFASTAEVVAGLGATPIFVDIHEDTFNLDARHLGEAVATARRAGLSPVGVIAVDLFGQPADYDAIEPFCAAEGLWLIADSAQSFGAVYKGRKVGTIGLATTTSFFPAKPLGCYGDGGAIFTDDDELAAIIRSLRVHGQGSDKYDNIRIGINGRLDTMQAAILLQKLTIFPDEIVARNRVASRYNEAFEDVAIVPRVAEGLQSVWAQYTLRLQDFDRAAFQAGLKEAGIPTAVYYPKPLHRQTAYRHFPIAGGNLPATDRIIEQVVSLPMHPYLDTAVQDRIVTEVRRRLGS